MKHTILLISSLVISALALAQESKPMQLSVEDAVKYALENSMKAKTAEIDILRPKRMFGSRHHADFQ